MVAAFGPFLPGGVEGLFRAVWFRRGHRHVRRHQTAWQRQTPILPQARRPARHHDLAAPSPPDGLTGRCREKAAECGIMLQGVINMRAYLVVLSVVSSVFALAIASPAAAEGFRAEIHGGWDHSSVSGEGDSGILYGVGVGYDMNLGSKAFIGVEANFDGSTQKECEASVIAANDRVCLRSGRDLSAAVRLGYNVSDRGKIYALGGYTNARFKASYRT